MITIIREAYPKEAVLETLHESAEKKGFRLITSFETLGYLIDVTCESEELDRLPADEREGAMLYMVDVSLVALVRESAQDGYMLIHQEQVTNADKTRLLAPVIFVHNSELRSLS